jgi:hypothetical protein
MGNMKTVLFVIVVVTTTYLALTFSHNAHSSLFPSPAANNSAVKLDGVDPPHAVDISGKVIPESSTRQPDKSIILAKDSGDEKWGELKPEAAFDHTKHNTDVMHSIDGVTVSACVECHHTDQPSARKAEEYLKRFERKEVLTAAQLETSKQPVKSCRACHFSVSSEETDEFPPKGVKYPKKTGRPPSGKLTNDVAYHINCLFCHDAAKKRDPKLKPLQECAECHIKF